MPHEPVLALVVGIVALLLIAAAAAIGVRRVHVPYVVGLVVVGIALGLLVERVEGLEPLRSLTLTPEVIVFIFLPTLIFEAAFNLDSRLLSRNLAPVLMLAAPGLLISTLVAGGLVAALTPLSIGPALLFGALISATDPVAVIALFKEIGAPKRLGILVEGESLFNDAAAIVLFKIILAVLIAGAFGAETVGRGVLDFIVVFGGGVLVGGLIGYLMIRSIALAQDDPLIEVTLSTVVAYAAFIVAEHYLEVSGVMATVGAGVVIGAYGSTRFTPEVKAYLRQFWEYAAFVANSLIFLLVGLSVDLGTLTNHLAPIGWAIAAVLVARAVSVFGLVPALRVIPGTEPIGWRYQTILFWGGLRGAVALALALSLPAAFPERDLIVALTIGVGMAAFGWLFYRETPEECGLQIDGGRGEDTLSDAPAPGRKAAGPLHSSSSRDFTRAEALRTAAFWIVTLGIGNHAMVGTGMALHIVDLGADAGLSKAQALGIFLPITMISIPTGILIGLAVDRFPMRFLIMGMMVGQTFMFGFAPHLGDPLMYKLCIAGWGFSGGFYGPLTVAALPNFFGRTHLGAIQGVMMMVIVIASALGPAMLAAVKSAFGSYEPGLHALAFLPLGVFLAAPFTRDPQRSPR